MRLKLYGKDIIDNSEAWELSLDDCRMIDLPVVHNTKGNLTFIEGVRHVPFEIKRVYYLYDVPGGAIRGGHAHKTLHQYIIAASGSFDVILDDACGKQRFHLSRSYYGLYVAPKVWRELDNFSTGSVCLVLASDYYEEDDYIRNYEDFLSYIRSLDKPICKNTPNQNAGS